MARPKHRQPPAERAGRAVPALGAGSGGRRLLRSLSAQDDHRVNAWKRGSELRELFNRPESLQLGRSIWLGAEILRIWRWFGFPGHTWLLAFERSDAAPRCRSEEHTSELQSHSDLVCRLLLEKKNKNKIVSKVAVPLG